MATAAKPPRDLRPENACDGKGSLLAWMTDVHFDFVDEIRRAELASEIVALEAEGVVITGDIAVAASVLGYLEDMARAVRVPLWFVLGNHDFYGGSIEDVRARAAAISASGGLGWLESTGAVRVGGATALVGVDGWGDARLGDFEGSPVVLSDFFRIYDLAGLRRRVLRERLAALGDAAAAALRPALLGACSWADHVVVATHVPPFRDACWHEAAVSTDDWLPFFSCAAVGDALLEAAGRHPNVRFTVLCGHTHGRGEVQIAPNMLVLTGGAEYGNPVVQDLLIV